MKYACNACGNWSTSGCVRRDCPVRFVADAAELADCRAALSTLQDAAREYFAALDSTTTGRTIERYEAAESALRALVPPLREDER